MTLTSETRDDRAVCYLHLCPCRQLRRSRWSSVSWRRTSPPPCRAVHPSRHSSSSFTLPRPQPPPPQPLRSVDCSTRLTTFTVQTSATGYRFQHRHEECVSNSFQSAFRARSIFSALLTEFSTSRSSKSKNRAQFLIHIKKCNKRLAAT